MADAPFTSDELAALQKYDTPTICNALEAIVPERRTTGFTTTHLVCADPSLKPIVGYARTATIRARQPGDAGTDEIETRYYRYIDKGPRPSVAVIQDLDEEPGFGAFWGEVNTTIHKALGSLGVVTNGSIRDLDMVAPGFQLLAGKVGPSHAHDHVEGFGEEVEVCGMRVKDGDVIHADRHGAVVVPHDAVTALPELAERLIARERIVLDACKRPDFSAEVLAAAFKEAAEPH